MKSKWTERNIRQKARQKAGYGEEDRFCSWYNHYMKLKNMREDLLGFRKIWVKQKDYSKIQHYDYFIKRIENLL